MTDLELVGSLHRPLQTTPVTMTRLVRAGDPPTRRPSKRLCTNVCIDHAVLVKRRVETLEKKTLTMTTSKKWKPTKKWMKAHATNDYKLRVVCLPRISPCACSRHAEEDDYMDEGRSSFGHGSIPFAHKRSAPQSAHSFRLLLSLTILQQCCVLD